MFGVSSTSGTNRPRIGATTLEPSYICFASLSRILEVCARYPQVMLRMTLTLSKQVFQAETWVEHSKWDASGFRPHGRGSPSLLISLHVNIDLHEEYLMPCPHCQSTSTTERGKKTHLGYRTFCCQTCKRIFNERTGTPYNFLEFPTDIVLLVVLWRVRYKVSLRDLAEMFLARGFAFTHETVRDWEARFAQLIADTLRAKRKGQAGRAWHVDET